MAEELHRDAGLQHSPIGGGLERYGHHSSVRRNIEQLAAVASPAWHNPAAGGNGHLSAGSHERLNVHLDASRLVRLVRDPSTIARNLPKFLVEWRLHDRKRLTVAG